MMFFRVMWLAMRILALPDTELTPEAAAEAAIQIDAAATPRYDAEFLAALTWRESRFDPTANTNPKSGVWFCGVTQLEARSRRACQALARRRFTVYEDTVSHLEAWRRFCRVDEVARVHRDRLRCTIAGYGHGVAGARRGKTYNASAVLKLAARLRGK